MLEMNKKWILVIILGIATMVLIIGGKKYMDKKLAEKEYQDGVELIQNYVTEYLVTNYEGIEKIEWLGVGVEWRNSPIMGPSLFGNYVDTDVKVFVSENNYFTLTFRLSSETEYNNDLKKYVKLDSLNPSNTDVEIRVGKDNAIKHSNPKARQFFENVKKSSSGSSDAKVIYNLDIRELKY